MADHTAAADGRPTTAQLNELAAQVADVTAKVDALTAGAQQDARGEPEPAERYFPTVEEFVSLWLLPTFRRPTEPLGMGTWRWCPRWRDHPEAELVFTALWDAWEQQRTEPLGMIEFTRDLLHILPHLCGEHGPFARCHSTGNADAQTQRHRHVPVAPAEPAPAGWWDGWWPGQPHDADGSESQLLFSDVEDFVTRLFLPTFRRDSNAVGMVRWHWCDRWWAHDEVVHHMFNLWYLYEARASDEQLVDFVRETYFLLPHIHGDDGPMRECTPSTHPTGSGHRDLSIATSRSRRGAKPAEANA